MTRSIRKLLYIIFIAAFACGLLGAALPLGAFNAHAAQTANVNIYNSNFITGGTGWRAVSATTGEYLPQVDTGSKSFASYEIAHTLNMAGTRSLEAGIKEKFRFAGIYYGVSLNTAGDWGVSGPKSPDPVGLTWDLLKASVGGDSNPYRSTDFITEGTVLSFSMISGSMADYNEVPYNTKIESIKVYFNDVEVKSVFINVGDTSNIWINFYINVYVTREMVSGANAGRRQLTLMLEDGYKGGTASILVDRAVLGLERYIDQNGQPVKKLPGKLPHVFVVGWADIDAENSYEIANSQMVNGSGAQIQAKSGQNLPVKDTLDTAFGEYSIKYLNNTDNNDYSGVFDLCGSFEGIYSGNPLFNSAYAWAGAASGNAFSWDLLQESVNGDDELNFWRTASNLSAGKYIYFVCKTNNLRDSNGNLYFNKGIRGGYLKGVRFFFNSVEIPAVYTYMAENGEITFSGIFKITEQMLGGDNAGNRVLSMQCAYGIGQSSSVKIPVNGLYVLSDKYIDGEGSQVINYYSTNGVKKLFAAFDFTPVTGRVEILNYKMADDPDIAEEYASQTLGYLFNDLSAEYGVSEKARERANLSFGGIYTGDIMVSSQSGSVQIAAISANTLSIDLLAASGYAAGDLGAGTVIYYSFKLEDCQTGSGWQLNNQNKNFGDVDFGINGVTSVLTAHYEYYEQGVEVTGQFTITQEMIDADSDGRVMQFIFPAGLQSGSCYIDEDIHFIAKRGEMCVNENGKGILPYRSADFSQVIFLDYIVSKEVTILDIGGNEIKKVTVYQRDNYMLPALDIDNFLGYLIDGGIVNPDASISAVNVTHFTAVTADFGMAEGAKVRMGKNFGLMFEARINKASYDYLIENNLLTAIGMIIVPDDYLEQYPDFTKEAVDAEYGSSADGRIYKEIIPEVFVENSGTDKVFRVSIINMFNENYARPFSARMFITLKYADGSTNTVYCGYSQEDNSSSLYRAAENMYLDREESAGETYKHKVEENGVTSYSPYDDAQRAQFKRIINNVIILDSDYAVEELGRGAARDYTVESVSKDTIVIKESVAGALENTRSLILDGKRIKAAFDYDADEGVLTVTINKIKVMSYNTGHYHYGVGSCIQEEYFDEKFNNWKNFYEETDCDIIGVQELLPWIDTARTLFSVEEFFDPVFVNGHSGKLDTGIFSKHIITEYSDGYLQDTEGSTRGYTKCYIDVNGVRVCVFCVHLSPASGAEDLRRQQIEYLLDAIKDEEYVIIFGDFNANNHEYDIFREYGYKLANGGEHGWKRTYNWQMNYTETANPALDRFIDNIIVSSNIIIESVEVLDYAYDYLTSDHLPIVAELIIN